jgi:FkbM family methyltransferase
VFLKLKQAVTRAAHRAGYHIGRYPLEGSLERHLTTLLSALAINCVLDVGAHEGEYYQTLRDIGYRGAIVSFEPLPENFDRLRHAAAGDPRWRGYQIALGEAPGSLQLNVPEATSFGSFLAPNEFLERRFPNAQWRGRTADVTVERLDQVFDEAVSGIAQPKVLLKMDTQGWDIPVVEGAGGKLAQIAAIQSELSAIPLYHGMRGLTESLQRYMELGYRLTSMFPVNVDEDHLTAIEFDCVLRRASLPPPDPTT